MTKKLKLRNLRNTYNKTLINSLNRLIVNLYNWLLNNIIKRLLNNLIKRLLNNLIKRLLNKWIRIESWPIKRLIRSLARNVWNHTRPRRHLNTTKRHVINDSTITTNKQTTLFYSLMRYVTSIAFQDYMLGWYVKVLHVFSNWDGVFRPYRSEAKRRTKFP